MYKLLIFCFLMANVAFAQKIKIDSNPAESEIYLYSDANEKPQLLGKTPFNSELKKLINTYVKKNTFIIKLQKEGYEDYKVLFAKTSNVDIDLSVNLKVSKKVSTIKKHDLLMIELFDIQKMIRGKNYGDALKKLDELEKKNKHFSIIAELKATTYYMQKDVEKALSYYRKAFALNSDNVDAYKMKVYLEKKLGVYADIQ